MQQTQQPQTDNYICEACGGVLRWNIRKQCFACASCGTVRDIMAGQAEVEEHPMEEYAERDQACGALPGQAQIVCATCGAHLMMEETQTAMVCPMCGSSQVSTERQTSGAAPDGVIPFCVDKEQAQENFRKWVSSRWFAPNMLKKSYQQGRLQGLYLPFWTFDAEAIAMYSGEGGEHYETEDSEGKKTQHTRWYPVSGTVGSSFDDIPVCASENSVNEVIGGAMPYSTGASKPFSGAYLSGFGAERYSVRADVAVNTAMSVMESSLREMAHAQILASYDEARVNTLHATYNDLRYKQVLLPAWTAAFAYKGKQYLYLVNGETGKVSGKRPYSAPKIIAAVLAAAAVLTCLFLWFAEEEEPVAAIVPPTATRQMAQDPAVQETLAVRGTAVHFASALSNVEQENK